VQDSFESLNQAEPRNGKVAQTTHFASLNQSIEAAVVLIQVKSSAVSLTEDYLSHCFDNSFDSIVILVEMLPRCFTKAPNISPTECEQ
jgi:hypothetical protein